MKDDAKPTRTKLTLTKLKVRVLAVQSGVKTGSGVYCVGNGTNPGVSLGGC